MKVLICGISGKMGQSIYQEIKALPRITEIIGFDQIDNDFDIMTYKDLHEAFNQEIDLVIDFTKCDISYEIINLALSKKIKVISGTTGFKTKDIKKLRTLSRKQETLFYWTPNFSRGYHLLLKEINDLKKEFKNIDIIETHNISKIDKPSGTSLMIANALAIPNDKIQSLRLHDSIATHEVNFIDDYEQITVIHKITNRKAFLKGFMMVIQEILNKEVS